MNAIETLKSHLEHAPKQWQLPPLGLIGWALPEPEPGFVCCECAGRIMQRGCRLPEGVSAVWSDQSHGGETCVLCERCSKKSS